VETDSRHTGTHTEGEPKEGQHAAKRWAGSKRGVGALQGGQVLPGVPSIGETLQRRRWEEKLTGQQQESISGKGYSGTEGWWGKILLGWMKLYSGWMLGNTTSLKGWSGPGMGGPERWWSHCPWRCSRNVWTLCWGTWFNENYWWWVDGWTGWSRGSFPTLVILWF